MGDRCYWQMYVDDGDDYALFLELTPGDMWDDIERTEDGKGWLIEDEQAPDGHDRLVRRLAEGGLRFYGYHDACIGAYDGAVFAAWDKQLFYVGKDSSNNPVLELPHNVVNYTNYCVAVAAIDLLPEKPDIKPHFLGNIHKRYCLDPSCSVTALLEDTRSIDGDTHFMDIVRMVDIASRLDDVQSLRVCQDYLMRRLIEEGRITDTAVAGARFAMRAHADRVRGG